MSVQEILDGFINEIAVELNPQIELYLIELYLDRVIPDKGRAFQAGVVAQTTVRGWEEIQRTCLENGKSNPVWLEQRELVIEYWISSVTVYSRDNAVLLRLFELGDTIGATLQKYIIVDSQIAQTGRDWRWESPKVKRLHRVSKVIGAQTRGRVGSYTKGGMSGRGIEEAELTGPWNKIYRNQERNFRMIPRFELG